MEEITPSASEKPEIPLSTQPAGVGMDPKKAWLIGIVAFLIIALIITGAILLLTGDPGFTSQLRDVFIIFMALESLVIGIALVVLVIQLAILTNLLQNEIKPILDTTNETVNTLRGTVIFISDNLAEPVIKMNEYLAAVKKFFDLIKPGRKSS
jgi:hypothetical protein